LWLTSYPPGADTSTTAATAQQVSDSGAPLGPRLRLPAGYAIDRATGHGLLLAPAVPQAAPAADVLWDPGSRRTSRTFAGVIAASAREIAWTPQCAPRCQVHVLDLATGRDTVIALPDGAGGQWRVQPGRGFLAVQVGLSPNANSGMADPAGGGVGMAALRTVVPEARSAATPPDGAGPASVTTCR
jgi:hypothetical protein